MRSLSNLTRGRYLCVLLVLALLYGMFAWPRHALSEPILEAHVVELAGIVGAGDTRAALDRLGGLALPAEARHELALAIGIATYARVLDPFTALQACDDRFEQYCTKGALYTYVTRISAQGQAALNGICNVSPAPACWNAVAYSLTHTGLDGGMGEQMGREVCAAAPLAHRAACTRGLDEGRQGREASGASGAGRLTGRIETRRLATDDAYLQALFPNFDQRFARDIINTLAREGAAAAIARYLADPLPGFNPHRFGHGVGRYLVEHGGDAALAYASCAPDPTIGCAHGVVFGYVLGLPGPVAAADVSGICPAVERLHSPVPGVRPDAQCLHGLGHAFAYQHGHAALGEILRQCRPLPQVAKRICWSGAFHSREDLEAEGR